MKLLHRSTHWGALFVAIALLIGMMVVGCDELPSGSSGSTAVESSTTASMPVSPSSSESEPSSTDTLITSTTVPPATTPTTEALSSAERVLSNGHIEAKGYIDYVWEDAGGRHLRIDYIDLLTDPAACTAAARRDGEIGPTETWDLDFYISNVNPTLREFGISDSVEIFTTYRNFMVDLAGTPCTWSAFYGFWNAGPLPAGDAHLPDALWIIERDGDTVVRIFQQYLP